MTDVSEAEVEAAAWALCADAGGAGKGGCEKDCACWTEARIALTAAAQVRAQAAGLMPIYGATEDKEG